MRGKVVDCAAVIIKVGITPAYAGKSLSVRCSGKSWRDHPRLCGEKAALSFGKLASEGSPPPMRGKVRVGEAYSRAYRITPAYAGKSGKHYEESMGKRDHPRLCGEKHLRTPSQRYPKGSPPPMRGKAETPDRKQAAERITPAYAGKRRIITSKKTPCGDHPRLCGEKL